MTGNDAELTVDLDLEALNEMGVSNWCVSEILCVGGVFQKRKIDLRIREDGLVLINKLLTRTYACLCNVDSSGEMWKR